MPSTAHPRVDARRSAAAIGLVFAALVGTSVWAERNVGPELLPHGFCFTWIPALLWLHVISDALIGLAYVSIPVTLWGFVRRRTDLPFNWMFLLFGLFIVSCGLTHFMAIWTVWHPDYWLDGSVKAFTAAASVATAAALIGLVPRALAMPTVEQLRRTTESLEREVERRREVEAALREAQAALERRVEERTRDLVEAKAAAEAEHDKAEAARAQAEAANRDKDVFIAMLSHELRNPMAPLFNAHRIIERTQPLDETGRGALAMARRQAAQLRRLVDDLLEVSRLTRSRIELRRERIVLQDVVAGVVESARPAIVERRQSLRVSMPPAPVPIDADPARIVQVVENLLSNASKYTPPGGDISLTLESSDDRATVSVTDTGVGLAPEDLERVFELFTQVDASPERVGGGLGIGLGLVRGLVSMHGGRAWAESDGPGRGATFRVELPRAGA
jgi:signal transduction histidine kinase